jgi:hypothetical protein
MPRAGFYNDNEYRAYPFVYKVTDAVPSFAELPSSGNKHMIYLTRDTGAKYRWTGNAYALLDPTAPALPDACILDAGVIMGLMSEFDPTQHSVWLESVSRVADVFTFTFRTDAPGAASQPLTFTRPADASEWLSEQVDAADWEGFFVTGPLTELAAQMPNNTAMTIANVDRVLEPARIQSLVKSYLRSVSLGNYRRTLVTPSSACETSSSAVNVREIVVNAEGLQGDLRLKEGYNCRISQTDFNREIRVAAEVGAGLPPDNELCSRGGELPLYAGEEPPEGSPFLSGGPACDETIATINGMGGPNVTLIGGPGVGVTTDSENFSVRVALDTNSLVGNCGA